MIEGRLFAGWLRAVLATLITVALPRQARAQTTPQGPNEWLCDASYQDCRAPLIRLIQNENVGIDVAFWFMQDARYKTEIISRWQAGVPVRVLVDPTANPSYPGNDQILADLAAAGIPMRMRKSTAPGILHWKMMLFVGQTQMEFSGANFSPTAFVPHTPYVDYEDETLYFTDDPSVVQSFMTEYDNHWIETTNYQDYANINKPAGALISDLHQGLGAELSAGRGLRAASRCKRYPKENQAIDVIMYRITDERETNAVIAAFQRGIPVRVLTDDKEYALPEPAVGLLQHGQDLRRRRADSRPRHDGLNHQKLVLFYANTPASGPVAPLSVFGSSNWTTPSANQQQEHNYFTLQAVDLRFLRSQFMRKWCSGNWAAGMPDYCNGPSQPGRFRSRAPTSCRWPPTSRSISRRPTRR